MLETFRPRGVLPKMAYTGMLLPKGIPFPGFWYMKGLGFHKPGREPGNEVGISLVEEYKMVG